MPMTEEVTIHIEGDLKGIEATLASLSRQAQTFSRAINRAFKDAIVGGKSFETVLRRLALRLAGMALDRALQPISNRIGRGIGALFGAFGRLYLSGSEAQIDEARGAALRGLERIQGKPSTR